MDYWRICCRVVVKVVQLIRSSLQKATLSYYNGHIIRGQCCVKILVMFAYSDWFDNYFQQWGCCQFLSNSKLCPNFFYHWLVFLKWLTHRTFHLLFRLSTSNRKKLLGSRRRGKKRQLMHVDWPLREDWTRSPVLAVVKGDETFLRRRYRECVERKSLQQGKKIDSAIDISKSVWSAEWTSQWGLVKFLNSKVIIRITNNFAEKFCPAAVKKKDSKVLRGYWLIAEHEHYMDCEIPEMDHKLLFNYEELEGKLFGFTSVEEQARIQIQLPTTFLKGSGRFLVPEDFWMQVRILTGNVASTYDFNWSHEHMSVSSWSLE